MKTKGFTLVELLVVIAILAILATVSVVGYTTFIDRANQSTAMQELTQIRDALIAEDINNDSFSIKTGNGGAVTLKTGTTDTEINAFITSLGLTNGTVDTITTGATKITYKMTEKGVYAEWDLVNNVINTGKIQ